MKVWVLAAQCAEGLRGVPKGERNVHLHITFSLDVLGWSAPGVNRRRIHHLVHLEPNLALEFALPEVSTGQELAASGIIDVVREARNVISSPPRNIDSTVARMSRAIATIADGYQVLGNLGSVKLNHSHGMSSF